LGLAAFAAPLAMRPSAGPQDPITDLINTLTGGGGSEPAPAPPKAPEPPPKPTKVKSVTPKGDFKKASNTEMGTTADVPVSSGHLFETDEYVVTQPKEGAFVGFDSLCTHEGCPVDIFDTPGKMSCGCHGATYDLATGKVLKGPAKKPLPLKPIVIENGKIYKAKKK
jgi:Rieske Fe-S protein